MAKCAQMRCSFQRFIDWQIGARYLLLNTMSNGHQTVERSIKDEQGPSPWRGVGGRSLYPSSGWKNSFNGRQTTSSWTAIHPAPLFRGVGGVLMKQMVGSCYHVLRSPLGEQIDFRNKFPSFGFFFSFSNRPPTRNRSVTNRTQIFLLLRVKTFNQMFTLAESIWIFSEVHFEVVGLEFKLLLELISIFKILLKVAT